MTYGKSLKLSILTTILLMSCLIWGVLDFQSSILTRSASKESFNRVEKLIGHELKSLEQSISLQLLVLQALGKEGLFSGMAYKDFSSFIERMVTETPNINSFLIANSDGEQYRFYFKEGKIAVDHTPLDGEAGAYDPRERPWYKLATAADQVDKVAWTAPYVFYTDQLPGLTASIAWNDQTGKQFVIAFDVLLTDISNLVQSIIVGTEGRIFLVHRNKEYLHITDAEEPVPHNQPLFTKLRDLNNPTLATILQTDYSTETAVSPDVYYVETPKGYYWVRFAQIDRLLPKYHMLITAPEKGLNTQLEQIASYQDAISLLIALTGVSLLVVFFIHFHSTTSLVHRIGQLNHAFSKSPNLDHFYEESVQFIAQIMNSQTTALFIFEKNRNRLLLNASHGPLPEPLKQSTIPYGQGLIGKTLKDLHTTTTALASKSSDAGPERPQQLLLVPIVRGIHQIGVLAIVKDGTKRFSEKMIKRAELIASHLTSITETSRFHLTATDPTPVSALNYSEPVIRGKVASPGYAYAPVTIDNRRDVLSKFRQEHWKKQFSVGDFEDALQKTTADITKLQDAVNAKLDDAADMIFDAHLMMLEDPSFSDAIRQHIQNGINAPEAILIIAEEFMRTFALSPGKILAEKVDDVKDLTIRLLSHLSPEVENRQTHHNRIVIAKELFPSDVLVMSSEGVKGIILVSGGTTSHLAILCRSLGIPVLLSKDNDILAITPETPLLLDANHGIAYLAPSDEKLTAFKPLLTPEANAEPEMTDLLQTQTLDQQAINLQLNVNLLSDISQAKHLNIAGIGLYRSEFPFMIRNSFPTEEEQFTIYQKVVSHIPQREMTFRTLDIGGDKILTYEDRIPEENPFLGLRAIRLSLKDQTLFREQLRAILRAGIDTKLRIMFPMIQAVDELLEAKAIVADVIRELKEQAIPCHQQPHLGMMVELPAAVTQIEQFAQHSDFFSIGTNDLTQYLLAVDRTNAEVAELYVPHHPAVLAAVAKVVAVATKYGKHVSVCGDMAGKPLYTPFLIGCGIRTLSVDPVYAKEIKETIANCSLKACQAFAEAMLNCETVAESSKRILQGPSQQDSTLSEG